MEADSEQTLAASAPRPRATYPKPMASRCESSRDGRKTLRNSAENTPPFFMTLVFLMLRVAVRFGCLNRNALRGGGRRVRAPACSTVTPDVT